MCQSQFFHVSSTLLELFEQEGRFPRQSGDHGRCRLCGGKVDPGFLAEYGWSRRSIERHGAQVRQALGFRESTRADEYVLAEWLADSARSLWELATVEAGFLLELKSAPGWRRC